MTKKLGEIKIKFFEVIFKQVIFIASRLERPVIRQRGATMIEYILLVVLIAVVAIVALKLVGVNLAAKFNYIATCISTTSSC